ncbi:MAG: hypothetical protein K2L95_00590 [Alphaproteobacteria bacterium]|nr:hypothetical protein [Alphaproteobacteria bacterium]
MHKWLRFFGLPVASLGAMTVVLGAHAVQSGGRGAYNNVRAGTATTSAARMPSMPVLPMNTIGNLSPNIPTTPSQPSQPSNPVDPDDPTPPAEPECPDGGVKDSDYTVENCMNDVLRCVNGGALPGGLNDLFNEDLRNAIINGMGLCSIQVEKCVTQVRKNCSNVYRSSADVWIDFNSRKIQPEYYSFVLRKTGLTPHQAENTCWLLDKNTYGPSFAAVANSGAVTSEYNNRVGAYNQQNGNVLIKTNPQGVTVNDGNPGVDGQRGHYARWDATTATCYLRVAAYNKDKHITNSWLFGALGDDKPAEVWKAAGDTFSCNKDLFGFSLMNDTSTAAVVGVGGGTVVGAGVGAIAGHGDREFDCNNKSHIKKLGEELRAAGSVTILNEYMTDKISANGNVTPAQCREIVELYNVYYQMKSALSACANRRVAGYEVDEINIDITMDGPPSATAISGAVQGAVSASDATSDPDCTFKPLNLAKLTGTGIYCTAQSGCRNATQAQNEVARLGRVLDSVEILQGEDGNRLKTTLVGAGVGAATGGVATAITAFIERNNINCRVGDGLEQVGFGKSYSIGSLKDFYVKWNLRLPDTIAPTAQVSDCTSWKNTCAMYTDLNQCAAAQFNYKPADASSTTLVRSPCAVSGSVCIENYTIAKSYGACE